VNNILSFDLEDWNQLAYRLVTGQLREPSKNLYRQVEFLLQTLADHGTKATFFVLGMVAEKYPDLIKRVAREGHEVGSHGYAHFLVHGLSQAEFKQDTQKSKALLEDIVGLPVEGYRAAEFSIRSSSLWALTVLAELGFKYDSSIFPIRHRRYGIPKFPPEVACYGTANGAPIIEIPITSIPVRNHRIPIAGGGYFRVTPFPILRRALRESLRNNPPLVVYFHPYEFESLRLNVFDTGNIVGFRKNMRGRLFNTHQNMGRRSMRSKLADLIQTFPFTTCSNFLKEANLDVSRKLLPVAS
jgi:polysaccharide deacetylase family protein (PEP-CTERM system associated)